MVKEEDGFTLIEMMIVLLIISVLVLIAIPNVTKHSKSIDDKGCEAFVRMAQGQVEAYKMEKHKIPSVDELIEEDYLPKGAKCPDGTDISIENGMVIALNKDGTSLDDEDN
ncbi:competence type IV pilus major pilin ComGC [Sporosarcina sp. Marseille-Q4943]|uniref:competence type IV pilus major pilin ComGC n=1 Tax=Sporosarcina sp. Marseille-Q4943 TaxID=2942204 RepID=UPI00208DDCC5|nr:competence type IV pilus major pilin ComGC [Sporosarcina sp. Marseille-Q4943]